MGELRIGAGEGNRTLVVSLEGFCSTIELHPHKQATLFVPTRAKHKASDANILPSGPPGLSGGYMVEGTGFEPVYSKRPDLQSGAFNRSATPPHM